MRDGNLQELDENLQELFGDIEQQIIELRRSNRSQFEDIQKQIDDLRRPNRRQDEMVASILEDLENLKKDYDNQIYDIHDIHDIQKRIIGLQDALQRRREFEATQREVIRDWVVDLIENLKEDYNNQIDDLRELIIELHS